MSRTELLSWWQLNLSAAGSEDISFSVSGGVEPSREIISASHLVSAHCGVSSTKSWSLANLTVTSNAGKALVLVCALPSPPIQSELFLCHCDSQCRKNMNLQWLLTSLPAPLIIVGIQFSCDYFLVVY